MDMLALLAVIVVVAFAGRRLIRLLDARPDARIEAYRLSTSLPEAPARPPHPPEGTTPS